MRRSWHNRVSKKQPRLGRVKVRGTGAVPVMAGLLIRQLLQQVARFLFGGVLQLATCF